MTPKTPPAQTGEPEVYMVTLDGGDLVDMVARADYDALREYADTLLTALREAKRENEKLKKWIVDPAGGSEPAPHLSDATVAPTAWIATTPAGRVLHMSKSDGWSVEVVSGPQGENMLLTQDEIHQALYQLAQRIEVCGASVELTHAVTLCCDLRRAIGNQYNPADPYAADCVRQAIGSPAQPNASQRPKNEVES